MRRMLLILLLLAGVAYGQFRRFGDSFEDDSRENFFRRRPSFNRANRFRDSDESDFFRSNRRRNSFDSDERFFRGGSSRNRFDDDSDEVFFGSNRNSFVSRPSTFNRNQNFRRSNTRLRVDSVEDLFEDLFDDDLDDRLRAQNTLARLGNNFASNRGSTVNRGFTSFNTRVGNNRFSTPSVRSNSRPFQSQFSNSALNHFSVPQQPRTNRFPSRTSNSNTGTTFRTPTTNRRFGSGTSFTNKRNPTVNSPNSIRSTGFGTTKRSSFTSPPGFNWPGGNGYYVSMSTGNSKPVTYFVKYDD